MYFSMKLLINLLVVVVLVSCGESDGPTNSLSGVSAGADTEALKETTATIINLNGLLWAKVLDIRPLKVQPDVYEVTCIEYRSDNGTKTYIMNPEKGKAWAP